MVIQEDGSFAPTKEGCALARFYLRFETVVLFREATPDSTIETLLHILSRAREFADLRLRVVWRPKLSETPTLFRTAGRQEAFECTQQGNSISFQGQDQKN